MERFSKWVGRRPGLENLSGLWSGQCVMRLALWRQSQEGVAGRAIPWGSPVRCGHETLGNTSVGALACSLRTS